MTVTSPRLSGKVALITGCGPNINGGIAYGFADEGAKVVCVDVRPEYAEACARAIRERDGDANRFDLRCIPRGPSTRNIEPGQESVWRG